MIKHIVLFQLKEEAQGATKAQNIEKARAIADRFLKEIPSLKAFAMHTNLEGAPSGNDDLVLLCEFEDLQGLHDYAVHPTHQEFVQFIGSVRESRRAIDYWG